MSRMPKNQASGIRNQAAADMRLETDRYQTTRVNKKSDRVYQRYVEDRERHNAKRPARAPHDQDFQLTGRIPRQEIMSTQRFSPREMEMELRRYEVWRSQSMSDTGRMGGDRPQRRGDTHRMSDTARMGLDDFRRDTRRTPSGNTQRMGSTQRMGNTQRMEDTRHGASQQAQTNPTARMAHEQPARNEYNANRLSRIMMYVTCALLMALMFVQIGRLAQIAAQTKQIASINSSLREMDIERNNLEVRLSMQQNINNIKKAAIDKLGMVYPEDGQIRVVALGQSDPSQTQTADSSGALEETN